MLKIGILLGDDIGLEVVPECVKVMQAAAGNVGLEVEWQELPIGRRGHELHGHTLPKVTADALETLNGWVLGPIGHSAYPRNDPTWVLPPIRKRFELFASIKPVKSYPNLPSVHKEPVFQLACGMFAEECRKVAAEFPDVTFEEVLLPGEPEPRIRAQRECEGIPIPEDTWQAVPRFAVKERRDGDRDGRS